MADIKITVDSSEIARATQHTTELEGATTRFKTRLDPLLAKEREFAKAIGLVNDGMRLGIVTNKRAISEINRLGKAYGYTQAQIDRTTASMTGIRKNTNRMNATIQNAGYQFGDFFVQVQSGQNALVAFSQQGAQLAGLLPGLAGAVTGVGLVIGSMLVRALMDGSSFFKGMKASIEGAREAIEAFEQSSSRLAKALKDDLPAAAIRAFKVFEEANLAEAIEKTELSLTKTLNKTEKSLGDLKREAKKAAEELKGALVAVELGYQSREFAEVGEKLKKALDLTVEVRDLEQVEALFRKIGSVDLDDAEQLSSIMETIAERAKYLKDQNKISAEVFAELENLVSDLGERLASLPESTTDMNNDLESIVDRTKELVSLFSQMSTLSGSIEDTFKRTALQASLVGEGMSKAVAGQVSAMRMKLEEERAGLTELYGADFASGMLSGRSAQLDKFQSDLESMAPTSSGGGGRKRTPLDAQVEAYKKFQKNIDDTLVSYRKQADLELKLIGMSKEEAKLTEFIFDLENKLGATRDQLNADQQSQYDAIIAAKKKEIELTKRQKLEEEKLAEAKKKVEAVASTLATETVGALRDIVNGTKTASQAFRDMAINIIQQIMNILIWQPLIESLTNSISGAITGSAGGGGAMGGIIGSIFGFQKGGAFSSGNVIPFANGGVVGSPTMFGMSGGRTGLMGEAGPEAIMPLKRGSDGKLGVEGGGNVTVHQTFNFSANGDESVKKIIAQAAPKIAQMTEAKIINSRQRGGQMRRAFG